MNEDEKRRSGYDWQAFEAMFEDVAFIEAVVDEFLETWDKNGEMKKQFGPTFQELAVIWVFSKRHDHFVFPSTHFFYKFLRAKVILHPDLAGEYFKHRYEELQKRVKVLEPSEVADIMGKPFDRKADIRWPEGSDPWGIGGSGVKITERDDNTVLIESDTEQTIAFRGSEITGPFTIDVVNEGDPVELTLGKEDPRPITFSNLPEDAELEEFGDGCFKMTTENKDG